MGNLDTRSSRPVEILVAPAYRGRVRYSLQRAGDLLRVVSAPITRVEILLCLAFLTLVVVAAFPGVIFDGRSLGVFYSLGLPNGPFGYPGSVLTPQIRDAAAAVLEEIWRYLVVHAYLSGHLPLWDPNLGAGTPLAAIYQSDAYFLPEIPFSALPFTAWDAYYLLRLVSAGAFTYLFLRALQISRIASAAGAVSYMLCGNFIWNINGNWANAPMLLPLLLYCLDHVVRERSRRVLWPVAATLVTWQIFTSGFPEVILLALALSGGYYLFRALELARGERRPPRLLVGALTRYIFVTACGTMLAAPLLLPFRETVHEAGVQGRLDTAASAIASPVSDIFGIFLPYFYGLPMQLWHTTYLTGYCGIVAPLIALLAVFSVKQGRHAGLVIFFGSMLLLFLLASYLTPLNYLVSHTPIIRVIFWSRYAAGMWCFCLAVLVAVGLDALPSLEARYKLDSLFIYAAFLAVLAAINLRLWPEALNTMEGTLRSTLSPVVEASIRSGGFFLAGAVLLVLLSIRRPTFAQMAIVALLAIELISYAPRDLPTRYDAFVSPPYRDFLARSHGPHRVFALENIGFMGSLAPLGLEDARNFDAFYIHSYRTFVENGFDRCAFVGWAGSFTGYQAFRTPDCPSETGVVESHRRFLDLLNVRYVLAMGSPLGATVPVNYSTHPPRDMFVSPPLAPGFSLGQSVTTIQPGLSAIDLSFARSGPLGGIVRLHLRAAPSSTVDLRTAAVPASSVHTSGVTRFSFAPVPDSAGKTYFFFVDDSEATPGTGPQLWEVHPTPDHPVAGALVDGAPQPEAVICAVEYGDAAHQPFQLVYNRDVNIYENRRALPRVFVVHQIQSGVSDQSALAQLAVPAFQPRQTLLLADSTATPLPATPLSDSSSVVVTHASNNEVELSARLQHAGYVALQDTYYPGWKAYLDGKEVPIYRSDVMFRAVYAPAGRHTIRFVYSPKSFQLGVGVMFLALLLLGGWALWSRRARSMDVYDEDNPTEAP